MGLEAIHDQLDELRERYDNLTDRDIVKWKGESQEHFRKRRDRYRYRVKHLDKLTDNLRRKAKAHKEAREERKDDKRDGLTTFDGVTVASWIAGWLKKSREHGWKGTVTSGYRTPEYSESLCYNMCGHPSCPGTCAGRSSNHSGKDYPAGAVDVSDYTNFERIQFEIGSPLRNDLPYDPVHFSTNGH